jgi:hypothetical protein
MKQILFKLFENLKQLGIKPNIGSRTNVTPIPGSEIDRLINRKVTPKEFDYSKPEVVDSMRSIVQNASDYVGQFTERQLKTFNDNVERIIGAVKPKETTAEVVDLATKEKITGPGLESLMREKGVAPISRKTIEAETLIKQFLDDDLISLNAKQIDQLSRGRAEDVFENIFGSKAKELITGKNTNESLNEVYNKLKTTKDARGRLPDDPNFDPSDINFKDGGSVSEDVKKLLKEEFIELINANPESFPDTNAGFRRFLKRKGSPVFNYKKGGKVKEKAEEPLSKYESYSENELLSSLDAKMPNLEIIEDELITMPMFEGKDIVPKGSRPVMPSEEYFRQRLFLDLAKGGRVKKRKRYADGGIDFSVFKDPGLAQYYYNQINNPNNATSLFESSFPGEPRITTKQYFERMLESLKSELPVGSTGSSISTTTEIPTIDPFSGQQVSAQDQAAFGTTSGINFSSKYESLEYDPATNNYIKVIREGSNAGGNEAIDPIVNTGIPFAKNLQNFLGNLYSGPEISNMQEQTFGTSGLPGETGVVSDLRHATAASQVRDKIANAVSMGYFNPSGIIPQSLGLFGSQVLGAANEIQSIRPNMQSLRDIGEDLIANFYGATQVPYGQSASTTYNQLLNNPSLPSAANYQRTVNVGSADPGIQALGRSIGSLDFSTMNALRNNADLLNTITGQTANMANGGLTKTIPPVRGPNPQGVESLFKKRYN